MTEQRRVDLTKWSRRSAPTPQTWQRDPREPDRIIDTRTGLAVGPWTPAWRAGVRAARR